MKHIFLLLLLTITTLSCGGFENQTVEEYITANDLETVELDDGVHIIVYEEGNSKRANLSSRVRVNYKGYLTDGSVFNDFDNVEFALNGVIRGWQIGMVEFGEGGNATLLIPSTAGYGNQSVGDIPANATLLFDVEIIEIK